MRALIQRVSRASVSVNAEIISSIGQGLLVLIGIEESDTPEDVDWLCAKIASLRIFSDTEGKMNLSLTDVKGEILLISQFTLFASTKKGNRPSFIRSAKPEKAIPLYEKCKELLALNTGLEIRTGIFGADMKVELINDGPVTIWIDSKNRE